MKKTTEQIGKTTEEAIRKGLEELKISRDDVRIEILEEPTSGGVLGILSAKLAKVRLTVDKKLNDNIVNNTKQKVDILLSDWFRITGESFDYTVEKIDNQIRLDINGDKISHLIGYRGKTIESFQSIVNSILQKEDEENAKIFVEINGYKKQKEEKLKALANKMAENVMKFRKSIKLEPMSAYERLIIHQELSSVKGVETESIGEEPRRRVLIRKKY